MLLVEGRGGGRGGNGGGGAVGGSGGGGGGGGGAVGLLEFMGPLVVIIELVVVVFGLREGLFAANIRSARVP